MRNKHIERLILLVLIVIAVILIVLYSSNMINILLLALGGVIEVCLLISLFSRLIGPSSREVTFTEDQLLIKGRFGKEIVHKVRELEVTYTSDLIAIAIRNKNVQLIYKSEWSNFEILEKALSFDEINAKRVRKMTKMERLGWRVKNFMLLFT